MSKVTYLFSGLGAIILAAFLHYFLPQVDVVRIIDTDIKRVDVRDGAAAPDDATSVRSKDVYFVLAETSKGKPRNYRNEDALLYGKWDSSDLHTKASSIAQNQDNLVALRHYGWRISFFSMFPNAVGVWEVEPGYRHIPVFNIVFLSLLAGGVGYLVWRVRRWQRRLADQRAEREARRAEEARRQAEEREAASRDTANQRALDDFLDDNGSGGR